MSITKNLTESRIHSPFMKGSLRKLQHHDHTRYDSAFAKPQRDEWFSQIWTLKGTRKTANELERRTAAYPEEIADRLIKMFSIKGDTVLDPFIGSGTTAKVAMQNQRNSIGYETDENLLPIITKKIDNCHANMATDLKIIRR